MLFGWKLNHGKMPKMAGTMRYMFMLIKRHIKIIMKDNGVDLAIHKIMSTRERNRIIQFNINGVFLYKHLVNLHMLVELAD